MPDPFAEFDALISGGSPSATVDPFSEFDKIISSPVQNVEETPIDAVMKQLTASEKNKPVDKNIAMEPITGVVGGFADIAEMAAQAVRLGNVDPEDQGPGDAIASWIINNKQALEKEYPYLFTVALEKDSPIKNEVRKALHYGVRSAIQSGATMVPGAVLGSTGGPIGTILGAAVSGGTIFGLAEYDRFAQDIYEYNKKHPDEAIPDDVWKAYATASAIQEGGLEFLSDAVLAKMFRWGDAGLPFKGTVRSILEQGGFKAGAKNFLKAYTASAAAEVSTEMAQSALETGLRSEAGLPQEQTPWQSAVDAIGPTLVSTLILGAGSHAMSARQRGHIVDALVDPTVDPVVRFDAAHAVYSELQKFDKANSTSLADKWGNVALYRIANNEAIDIDADVAQAKGIMEIAADKEKESQLNTDLEKFEQRQQPTETPVEEEKKPEDDKAVRQLYGYETFNYLKQSFLNKGMDDGRATELAKTIMGAKEDIKAPETITKKSILLDKSGKPIETEVPVDSIVSTSGANVKESDRNTILQLPEMLRQFAIQSKSNKPFSSKGGVTAFLKTGKIAGHQPFQIGEKSWIALPNHIVSLIKTAKITTQNVNQPPGFIFTPNGLKVAKKRAATEQVDMGTFKDILRDDDILAKNGQPFFSPASALANLKSREKTFKGISTRYAIVPIGKNEKGKLLWIGRRRSQLSIDELKEEFVPTAKEKEDVDKNTARLESEVKEGEKLIKTEPNFGSGKRQTETSGNVQEQPGQGVSGQIPESTETVGETKEEVPEHRQNKALRENIDQLTPEEKDQALKDLRSMTLTSVVTGLKNRLAYMLAPKKKFQVSIDLDSLKYLNDALGHENGDQLIKEFAKAVSIATDEAYHISGGEFIIQGDSKTNLEKIMKALTKALSKTTLTIEAGNGRIFTKKGVDFSYGIGKDITIAEKALAEHKRLRTVSGQRAERGAVPRGLVEVTPTATEKPQSTDTSTTVPETQKVEEQPRNSGKIKERIYAKTITARLEKGENVSDELVNKFPSVAKKWQRNNDGVWEKKPDTSNRLMTEREREAKEDIRNVDKAIKKQKAKQEKEDVIIDTNPVRKSPKYLTSEQVNLLVDRHFQFDRNKGVYVPKPVSDHEQMVDSLYALINYRWHNDDGKVNLEYVAKWIDDLCTAYDNGRLDKYFGTTEEKTNFNETLDQLIGFINVVSEELANQQGVAKLAIGSSKLNPLAQQAKERWGTNDDPTGMGRYMFADGSYLAGTTEHYDVADLMPEDQLEQSDDYVEAFNRNYNKVIDWFLENARAIRLYLTEDIDRRNNLVYKELHLNVFENLVISNEMFKQLQRLVRMGNGHIVYDIVKRDGKVISGETNSLSQFMRDLNNAKFAFGTKKGSVTVKQVQEAIAPIIALWKMKPEIIVVDNLNANELPIRLQLKMAEEGFGFNGVFIELADKPTVFLVAKEFSSIEEVQQILLHEVVGHFGLQKVMGNKVNSILNQVYYGCFNNQKFKEIVSKYGFNVSLQADRLAAAEEYLAYMAETNSGPVSLWKRIISTMKRILNNIGFNIQYSDNDIKVLLANINKALQTGQNEIDPGTLAFDGVNWALTGKVLASGENSTVTKILQDLHRVNTGQAKPTNQPKFSLTGGVAAITPTTPVQQSKNLFNAETKALIRTIASLKPGALPKMTLMEQILKSPEWYSHPILRRIVDHAINRHDRFYELFNDFNGITDKDQQSIIDQTMTLKNKGLTKSQIFMGETSADYKLLDKIIDDLDTGVWREGLSEGTTHDDYLRQQNVPADVVAVFKKHRDAYDKALDLLIKPMKDVVNAIESDAKKTGKKAKYPTMQTIGDDGKSTTVTLREVLDHMNSLRGTYAPRLREPGDWEITAKKGDTYYRYHKSLRYDAELLAEKLRQQGFEVNPVKERERLPEDVYSTLRIVNTAHLLDIAMQRTDAEDADMKAHFSQELLKEVADLIRVRGFRSSMVKRRPGLAIRGYITDPNERFVRYINNISAGTAKAEAAKAMFQEITGRWEGEGEARKKILGIDPMTERRAYDVATRYIEEQLRNADSTDRVIGYLKSVATMKYLGFNPHAWLVNILSLGTTVPMAIHQYVLNGKGSITNIAVEVSKASTDYVKVMRGDTLTNEAERAFMDEIKRKGYDDPKYTRDAAGTIQRTHGQLWNKLMYYSMFVFGKTEQWIRGTTMLAAYRLAKKNDVNVSEEDAIKKAYDASNKAHGVYGKATLPSAALGKHPFAKFIQLLYTFQKFPHNYLQMLYDVGFKKKNIKGFMFGLMSPIILGGAAVWPFKDLWFGIMRGILRLLGIPVDPEKWFWDKFRNMFGKSLEKVARHGLFGLAGLDISGSLAIGVGVPKNVEEMFGVASGLASDISLTGKYLSTGQYLRATEKIVPTAFGNVIRAIREMNTGVVDTKGRRIWDDQGKPMVPGTAATAARVIGFRTATQAVMQERTWEAKREMASFRARRDKIYEEYRSYLVEPERDPKELQNIKDKIYKYNAAVKQYSKGGIIPFITRESMLTQVKSVYRPKKNLLVDLKKNR